MENKDIEQSYLNKTFQDKFYFFMNLPECLMKKDKIKEIRGEGADISPDSIKFSIITANIPKITVRAEEIKAFGSAMKISSHTREPYDPLTISFKIDNKFRNYLTFYEWLNLLFHETEGHYNGDKLANDNKMKDYMTNIGIAMFDEYNKTVIQWQFTHAFILQLDEINLTYKENQEIECKATFGFSQMKIRNMIDANAFKW